MSWVDLGKGILEEFAEAQRAGERRRMTFANGFSFVRSDHAGVTKAERGEDGLTDTQRAQFVDMRSNVTSSGRSWSAAEEERALFLWVSGMKAPQIAEHLDRTTASVKTRIMNLKARYSLRFDPRPHRNRKHAAA